MSTLIVLPSIAIDRLGKQIKPTAPGEKRAEPHPNRSRVVLEEVGNRLAVWCEPSGQTHPFQVGMDLALQLPARLDPAPLPVEVDRQKCRRMVARPCARLRLHSFQAPLCQRSNSSTNASFRRTAGRPRSRTRRYPRGARIAAFGCSLQGIASSNLPTQAIGNGSQRQRVFAWFRPKRPVCHKSSTPVLAGRTRDGSSARKE